MAARGRKRVAVVLTRNSPACPAALRAARAARAPRLCHARPPASPAVLRSRARPRPCDNLC